MCVAFFFVLSFHFLNPQHHWLVIGLYGRCVLLGLLGCIHFGWFMKQPQTFPAEKSVRQKRPCAGPKSEKSRGITKQSKIGLETYGIPAPLITMFFIFIFFGVGGSLHFF